jgi:hypothetical protein
MVAIAQIFVSGVTQKCCLDAQQSAFVAQKGVYGGNAPAEIPRYGYYAVDLWVQK